jgi:hypothetical protein
MMRYFLAYIAMPFWADPKNTMVRMLEVSGEQWQCRIALSALMPGFPRCEPPEEPVPPAARPIPTDVPMPEPMDVPVPEPRDVPPPDPGTIPKRAQPRPDEINPKPRRVP